MRETHRLEIENVSGRAPRVLLQVSHAKIFAQNLRAITASLVWWLVDQRYRNRRHTYRINFANTLSKMKSNLVRLLERWRRLLQRMADAVVAMGPGRAYPRHLKKVRVPGIQQQ